MKAERFIRVFGNIDEKHIIEATQAKNTKHTTLTRLSVIAASFALLIGAAFGFGYLLKDNSLSDTSMFVIENGVLLMYTGDSTEVVIPEGVKTVSKDAFSSDSALNITKLSANKNTVFEKDSFSRLEGLKCIEINNVTESELKGSVDTILSCNAEELATNGIGLKYEYTENGGTPIYSVTNCDGISVAFNLPLSDEPQIRNPLAGNLMPSKVIISSDIPVKGISVGMNADDVKSQNIEWDDVYFTTDYMGCYTVLEENGMRYTFLWSMTEEQYSAWLNTLENYDRFSNARGKFLYPYESGKIGAVEEIVMESVTELDRYIVNFDYDEEVKQTIGKISYCLPDSWEPQENSDKNTIFLRYDNRYGEDVIAMELYTPIYVDESYTMDENTHSLTKVGGTWQAYENYTFANGVTENGYHFVKYDILSNGNYYAHYYIRLSENFILQAHFSEVEDNYTNVQDMVDTIKVVK